MSESVVDRSPAGPSTPTIVVGVDGSAASRDALKWAADYAGLVKGQLLVVSAWEWPVALGVALPLPEDYSPIDDAKVGLNQTISEVLGEAHSFPLTIEIIEGSPAAGLVDAAAQAALLVVGSRGHGGFAGLLLGSTSEHCARHAACPVVVVRHQKAGDDRL